MINRYLILLVVLLLVSCGSDNYQEMTDACDECPYDTTCSIEKDLDGNIEKVICTEKESIT